MDFAVKLRRVKEDVMARYELEDAQWDLIKGLFPRQQRGGRWNDHRVTLNGMLWVLRSLLAWIQFFIGFTDVYAATGGSDACTV